MDFCRNVSLSSGLQPPQPPFPSTLDDLFSGHHHTEEGDLNMEWLSIFVEDCLSSSGNCLPPAALPVVPSGTTSAAPRTTPAASRNISSPTTTTTPLRNSLLSLAVPGKARSKRKRSTPNLQKAPFRRTNCWYPPPQEPPLLQQVHWLADSELIQVPAEYKKKKKKWMEEEEMEGSPAGSNNGQVVGTTMRRCSHCLSQRTPQWRAGPLGPKTLCNACGVRYKSGRLLPEYRPAKSPTFVSYKHSNSHKKVLEMRMSLLSSTRNSNSS